MAAVTRIGVGVAKTGLKAETGDGGGVFVRVNPKAQIGSAVPEPCALSGIGKFKADNDDDIGARTKLVLTVALIESLRVSAVGVASPTMRRAENSSKPPPPVFGCNRSCCVHSFDRSSKLLGQVEQGGVPAS